MKNSEKYRDDLIPSDNYDLDLLRKPKSKKINSNKKGGTFSRKICNLLNERFNVKEFSKTPGSGAYATTHNLPEHLKIYGDLITPKNFRFCVELKKGYNKITLGSWFNKKSQIWDFITQSEKDSLKSNKISLLIFQQDREVILFILAKEFTKNLNNQDTIEIKINDKEYTIGKLEDILNLDNSFWFSTP